MKNKTFALEFVQEIDGDNPSKYFPFGNNARLLLFARNRRSLHTYEVYALQDKGFILILGKMRHKGEKIYGG